MSVVRECPKTGEKIYCDWICDCCSLMDIDPEDVIAGCGSVVYKKDNYVCPYFARPDEWAREHGMKEPCEYDREVGTNRCTHAILLLDLEKL